MLITLRGQRVKIAFFSELETHLSDKKKTDKKAAVEDGKY